MIVQSDHTHFVRVEPVSINGRVVPFFHAEVMEWNKETKRKLIGLYNSLRYGFALSDNAKLTKFCRLIGGNIVGNTPAGTIIRFK